MFVFGTHSTVVNLALPFVASGVETSRFQKCSFVCEYHQVMQPLAVVKAAYMATTLSVLFCIPLYLHSTRGALMNLYVNHIAPGPVAKESNATHLMFSAVVVVVTLAMALVLTNLGLVVAINGAVCATLIMLVFPGRALPHALFSRIPSGLLLFHSFCPNLMSWASCSWPELGVVIAASRQMTASSNVKLKLPCSVQAAFHVGLPRRFSGGKRWEWADRHAVDWPRAFASLRCFSRQGS